MTCHKFDRNLPVSSPRNIYPTVAEKRNVYFTALNGANPLNVTQVTLCLCWCVCVCLPEREKKKESRVTYADKGLLYRLHALLTSATKSIR